jgi:DNA invertase Pin-like site-specific DNA recombinase
MEVHAPPANIFLPFSLSLLFLCSPPFFMGGFMKIGYVRVSKQKQNEELQIDALKKAGCDKWFLDKMTGSKAERKGLAEALAYLRSGDTFVVWKLDRAGRSLTHLIELLKGLKERDIEFISLTEQIDTTTPGGKLIFHLMGALAEFERDLIRERTNAGLAAARARGRVGGRPRKLKTSGKVALARRMFADHSHSIPEICAALGISRATLYRYVKEAESTT